MTWIWFAVGAAGAGLVLIGVVALLTLARVRALRRDDDLER